MTPSAHSWKNLKIANESSSKKFYYVRDFATATGEVNTDIALEGIQHFGGIREDFVLYFSEIIKTTWIW